MDPEQLGRLLDRYADALALYARQWCDVPEDVVQDAFVKLARQRPTPLDPVAWLFRAVRNRAIDAGIAARRRRRHEHEAAAEAGHWFEPGRGHGPGDVDPEAASAELARLPVEEREVIVAHLWGGLTFEQIAATAGCSSSTAHRLYARGLDALRERLGVSWPGSRPIPS